MKRVEHYLGTLDDYHSGVPEYPPFEVPSEGHPANLVSSIVDGQTLRGIPLHAPVIDVDIPCKYIPSTTSGHGHLYFDSLRLTWPEYEELLKALVKAGIVEPNYLAHSQVRQETCVRLPHVKKEKAKAA